MDAVTFIQQSLAQAQLRLVASCEGLNDAEARWRPGQEANCIGFLLWHVARAEDGLASGELGEESLWVRAGDGEPGWHVRFGQDVETPAVLGDRQSALGLEVPALRLLREYQAAASERASALVGGLSPADLDRPSRSWRGMELSAVVRHLATHKNNHHGQIDFLRGLQQSDWDLPMGTGVRLPR
jgi:uncharacterized damage-inducible protein DinB